MDAEDSDKESFTWHYRVCRVDVMSFEKTFLRRDLVERSTLNSFSVRCHWAIMNINNITVFCKYLIPIGDNSEPFVRFHAINQYCRNWKCPFLMGRIELLVHLINTGYYSIFTSTRHAMNFLQTSQVWRDFSPFSLLRSIDLRLASNLSSTTSSFRKKAVKE